MAQGIDALASANSPIPTVSKTPKISVVDDDENIHIFVKDLGDLGHFKVVGSFYSGAQALERLP
ncbi:MAG: hypothetical protein DME24_25820, partial [Verrucomicrobia bacterium]